MPHIRRLEGLRRRMREEGIPAILVTSAANRLYMSGFGGSAGVLLITPRQACLLTDFRYAEAARHEAPAFTVVQHGRDMLALIAKRLSDEGIGQLAIEAEEVTVGQERRFRAAWPELGLLPRDGLVEGLRQVKDAGEVACISQAMAIAEEAFARLLPEVRPGRREKDLALDLEFAMRRLGADGPAFDFIVASGPRSSLPHAHPTERELAAGELVTFDFGARYKGYHSDITRTVMVGEPDDRQRQVYETVRAAQQAGLEAVRAGATGGAVDKVVRDLIAAAGFGEQFGHSTGHGVGLDVHELPRLAPGRDEERLEAGMVVTVEPGIYIPGWGGVRIEDTVLVTDTGCQVLCSTTKELVCL